MSLSDLDAIHAKLGRLLTTRQMTQRLGDRIRKSVRERHKTVHFLGVDVDGDVAARRRGGRDNLASRFDGCATEIGNRQLLDRNARGIEFQLRGALPGLEARKPGAARLDRKRNHNRSTCPPSRSLSAGPIPR